MTHRRPQHDQPNPKRSTHRPGPLLLASLSLVLTFCHSPARGSSITYNLQSYLPLQNGYTLSGTITTDGTIGTLTSSDITAWSFEFTLGSASSGFASGPSSSSAYVTGLIATDSALILPQPSGGGSVDDLELSALSQYALVYWSRHGTNSPGVSGDLYVADDDALINSGNLWEASNANSNAPGISLGGINPWIIATTAAVPEPGSLTLALLGTLCLAVGEWTRRRRRAASSVQASPALILSR